MAAAWWGALALVAAAAAWRLLRDDPPGVTARRGARFAGRGDLRRLRRARDAWFPLGYVRPRGIPRWLAGRRPTRLWRLLWGPLLRLPNEAVARHVLVVGLTGAGKTSTVTMPVLLEAARHGVSAVVFDLKYGEDDTLASAAMAWQRADRDVCVFAPLDAASLCWNPLDGCGTMAAAQRIATMLFEEPRDGSPDLGYWAGVERHVCAALICAVAADGGAAGLDRVRALSAAGPDAVRAYVHGHAAAELLERHLGAYRTMLPKDQAGILQGIASRLDAWSDPAVCAATRAAPPHRRVPLDRLRREPILLIVGIPQSALERCHWLWRLFLRDLTSRLLRPRASGERVPVLALLEELPAWGALPAFAEHLATLRSRGVSVMATIQSEAQGEHVYGRAGWAAVSANLVTKVYLAPLADGDAERLSRALGLAGVPDAAHSTGPRTSGSAPYRRVVGVPLCSPQELQGIDAGSHEILVRGAGVPPARLWCPPYYRRPEYLGLVPTRPPTTAEITVYHDLRTRITSGPAGRPRRRVMPRCPARPRARPRLRLPLPGRAPERPPWTPPIAPSPWMRSIGTVRPAATPSGSRRFRPRRLRRQSHPSCRAARQVPRRLPPARFSLMRRRRGAVRRHQTVRRRRLPRCRPPRTSVLSSASPTPCWRAVRTDAPRAACGAGTVWSNCGWTRKQRPACAAVRKRCMRLRGVGRSFGGYVASGRPWCWNAARWRRSPRPSATGSRRRVMRTERPPAASVPGPTGTCGHLILQ